MDKLHKPSDSWVLYTINRKNISQSSIFTYDADNF
jgi:hypothetical protein